MKLKCLSQCLLATVLVLPQFVGAAPGHTHGHARLDVAQDNARLEITLESPLESLVGFEHAPRTPRERELLEKALATLRAPQSLLELPAAAACRLEQTGFSGPGINADGTLAAAPKPTTAATGAARKSHDHGHEHHDKGREAHADLTVSWRYACTTPAALGSATVRLFDAFPKLRRLDIQVAGRTGQNASRMTARGRERSFVINR